MGAGCFLMGFYSTYSLPAMMGTNVLVAYHLLRLTTPLGGTVTTAKNLQALLPFLRRPFFYAFAILFPVSVFFGLMPKIIGPDYALTNGGFCYADFTSPPQAALLFFTTLFLLSL